MAGILAVTLCTVAGAPAWGQAARSGGDTARATQQMQQLASERTALQADNAKLKDEVADLQKKLDKSSADGAAASRAKELTKQLETATRHGAESAKQAAEALEKSRAQMQELITRIRATAQDLKTVETDRNSLRGQLESRERDYTTCVEHNVGLYDVGSDALNRLDHHGLFSKMGEAEPFTQIARARLDNLIDDYRQRLEELRAQQAAKADGPKSP